MTRRDEQRSFAKPATCWRLLCGFALAAICVMNPAWGKSPDEATASGQGTRVPKWDARGIGPLPWQGIACVDMNDEGTFIAVGTVAPPGDPNVFLLDGNGKILQQQHAGQRWIHRMAIDENGSVLRALCTSPDGRAGDAPTVYRFGSDGLTIEIPDGARGASEELFHYGDHSNHIAPLLQRMHSGAAGVCADRVMWLTSSTGTRSPQVGFKREIESINVSVAASRSGYVVVGCTGGRAAEKEASGNLFLLHPQSARALWSRPVSRDTAPAPGLEKGTYGSPIPNRGSGKAAELAQEDVKVWAPLSVALYVEKEHEAPAEPRDDEKIYIAAADYQGWQRWITSSATEQPENYGVRFPPSRPTIHVYDKQGKVVRRFGPENFEQPFWCDLLFAGNGTTLLAFPHNWVCRQLAGQTILPADVNVRSLYVLDLETGRVKSVQFPDAISDVAVSANGKTVVACWDGRVYMLDMERLSKQPLPAAQEIGGAGLVRITRDGSKILVAATNGAIRMLDGKGQLVWETDLNRAAQPGDKSRFRSQKGQEVGPGIWRTNSGRTPSDLGGQMVIEAPQGLILIDPNAGLSFEQDWAKIKAAGLDPMQVKYVLLTHEHGDHAPGAYLWRAITGARIVASAEAAYGLQHHIPIVGGYGFHPPIPTDIAIREDADLDLAGLKMRAIRLPGHTYGSLGCVFEKAGKKYVAIGDLIMPDGLLGYSGSVNFSARDALESLRKLAALKADVVLPGHGSAEGPDRYVAKGIAAAVATGWGKMPPEKPDPFYGFRRRNYLVVGWNEPIQSADYGDVNGDGRPDVVLLIPSGKGSAIKIHLNKGGKFDERPDEVIEAPGVERGNRIRMGDLNGDTIADFLVAGQATAAFVVSQQGKPAYRIEPLAGGRGIGAPRSLWNMLATDWDNDGRTDALLGPQFGRTVVAHQTAEGHFQLEPLTPQVEGAYLTLRVGDVNGDRREDLISSYGAIFLRQADGTLPDKPTIQLPTPDAGWTSMATDDFNNDGRPDLVLISYGESRPRSPKEQPLLKASVFYNSGKADRPFVETPSATLNLPLERSFVRDGPTVGDWNGDGAEDLILCAGQGRKALILLGGAREGLDLKRSLTIPLDFSIHYETKVGVADFDGDGKADLAVFGITDPGPRGVYISLQREETGRQPE